MTTAPVVVALADFLRARLDEDVAAARRAMIGSWTRGAGADDSHGTSDLSDAVVRRGLLESAATLERAGQPAHAETIRRTLALAYADHPDYRAEWRPARP